MTLLACVCITEPLFKNRFTKFSYSLFTVRLCTGCRKILYMNTLAKRVWSTYHISLQGVKKGKLLNVFLKTLRFLFLIERVYVTQLHAKFYQKITNRVDFSNHKFDSLRLEKKCLAHVSITINIVICPYLCVQTHKFAFGVKNVRVCMFFLRFFSKYLSKLMRKINFGYG